MNSFDLLFLLHGLKFSQISQLIKVHKLPMSSRSSHSGWHLTPSAGSVSTITTALFLSLNVHQPAATSPSYSIHSLNKHIHFYYQYISKKCSLNSLLLHSPPCLSSPNVSNRASSLEDIAHLSNIYSYLGCELRSHLHCSRG